MKIRKHIYVMPELGALLALILLSTVMYTSSTITVIRWNDPTGYTYAGLRIAETGQPTFYDVNNERIGPYFTLHAFKVRLDPNNPNFYPNYSIGLPLLIALARSLLPIPMVEFYVVPILGVIGLVALFALGRMLFGKWVGLLATGLLAFNFTYWSQATENFSDVPAVTCLLLGILFSLRATKKNQYTLGLLSGVTLGYACLIRYPSVLAIAPLIVYLIIIARRHNMPYRSFAGLLIGLAFLSLLILTYNSIVFGGAFTTGYSPKHGWVPWPAFSWRNFLGQSPIRSGGYRAVLSTLWENFHLGLLLALVGLLIMPRSKALLLGGNAAVVCGLYAFYIWSPEGSGARFVLFAFPMICLAMAFAVVHILGLILRHKRPYLLGASTLAIILIWHLPRFHASRQELLARNIHGEAVVSMVEELTRGTEPNAVFISHKYNDMIILYGKRSALYYAMLAPPDPVSQSYRVVEYEPGLVTVVDTLLEHRTPVYVIKEPEDLRLKQGPIDPYPILSAHFELAQVRTDPAVYRIASRQASLFHDNECAIDEAFAQVETAPLAQIGSQGNQDEYLPIIDPGPAASIGEAWLHWYQRSHTLPPFAGKVHRLSLRVCTETDSHHF